jgi:predicted transposase/invertase (TIGR01784 family)
MLPTYDNAYKKLFSHPELVKALILGFFDPEIAKYFNLETLKKERGNYVADDLRDREDDIIWSVKFKNQKLYIFLLLEFQSSPDSWMAVRIVEYVSLLCKDVITSQELKRGDLLPAVLPIVLYNGSKEWNAKLEFSDLFAPVPKVFSKYQIKSTYFLIAENRFTDEELRSKDNLAAIMFRMENSQTPKQFEDALESLIEWTKRPEHDSLRRAFTMWIKRVLFPRKLRKQPIPDLNDLHEVRTMLERVDDWTIGARQEGMQQGDQKGALRTAREAAIEALEINLDISAPKDVIIHINQETDMAKLKEMLRKAFKASSLEEFQTWLKS